jgi:hypothetical protein
MPVVAVVEFSSTQERRQIVPDSKPGYFSARRVAGHLDASMQEGIAHRLMNWR